MSLAAAVAIAVSLVNFLLNVIIHVGSLYHLREVERHTVEHDPGLSVCVEMFVASSRNCRGTGHQLRGHRK